MDKSRDNSLFQETSYFEYCSESKKFLIFLEKSVFVQIFTKVLWDRLRRSIALNEINS